MRRQGSFSFFVFFFFGAAAVVAAGADAQFRSGRPGIVPDADIPRILAFDVTPKTLKDNRVNFIRLYFKFYDGMADLKGGQLNIKFIYKSAAGEPLFVFPPPFQDAPDRIDTLPGALAVPAGRRNTSWTYPLTESVFTKKTGEFRLWFGLLAENFATVTIGIGLKDGDGTDGIDESKATLVRSAKSSGPKQGFKIGQLAYDFTLLDKANNRKTLSDFRGKVVLLNFSTMWCHFCQDEAAELQPLYLKYRTQGFIILSALHQNYAGQPIRTSDCKTWAETYGLTFPVLAELFLGVYWPYYAFPIKVVIPNNVLIDRSGRIRWKKAGFLPGTWAQMEAKLQQLLAE